MTTAEMPITRSDLREELQRELRHYATKEDLANLKADLRGDFTRLILGHGGASGRRTGRGGGNRKICSLTPVTWVASVPNQRIPHTPPPSKPLKHRIPHLSRLASLLRLPT